MFGILIILIIGSLNSFFSLKIMIVMNTSPYLLTKALLIFCLNIFAWYGVPIPI